MEEEIAVASDAAVELTSPLLARGPYNHASAILLVLGWLAAAQAAVTSFASAFLFFSLGRARDPYGPTGEID